MNKLVYCNNCFAQPSRTLMFYVTTCAHVYCQTCKEECTRYSCKMCGATCTTAALSQTMSQDVRELFKDPKQLLQRAMMISEFQVSQLVRLATCLRQEVSTLKANHKKATELGIKYKQQAESLRKENAALKNELSKLRDRQSSGIDIRQSPSFLTRPDYPTPPAFEKPTASQSSNEFALHTPSNRSQRKKPAVVTGYTPSKQAVTMMAGMGISQQRSQHAYDDGHHRGGAIVAAVTPPHRFSTANAGSRRSIQDSESSMSSCFRTPSTDSLSGYNTSIPAIAPHEVGDNSKRIFNPSIRLLRTPYGSTQRKQLNLSPASTCFSRS
ncbi:zip homologous protein 2-like isoform X6 [Dermacentor silvarum]|uniref:zip homologous protein 2-like isoform X1 n=1 Tax=Dermacentor silvarum TaxID=543639 RepID=UPI0021009DC4|nr:zip homologous protein 2-like isoform X1 [Dermacentor silvarum]XP_049527977.1 zip homologous protein 2-like isoform X2 [Dermacentor silvarum]XP_049527978.1 zip homologous protein 2-like isoform X3 [Dermacentor silvarum]XP_049527979.1 zip homologous protein 2-like isoform X4 [Dermacentor silvarum]XP_049527980.1 zip homologous protein 2-like isoform X5 [Dermacentor silvarum]XP_049527981.1 zip homologous protein 2-like isoform X6 [Dermacentor silvarum]